MNTTPAGPARRRRSPFEIQREVLFALVLREMKARVGGQWVGAIWTLFEPMAHTIVLVVVLGFVGRSMFPGVEIPVFLVTGLIPFFLFQNLALRLMDGIEANRGLFAYRQVKPLDTLLSRAIVETLMNLLVYGLTLFALGWIGYHVIPEQPLEMIAVNAVLVLFGTAFGIFAAVVGHDRARLRSFIRMMFLPLYFSSGVIFRVELLPMEYLRWLLWNPLLHLIEISRHAFIPQYPLAPGVNLAYPVMVTLVTSALALALYHGNRRRLIAS